MLEYLKVHNAVAGAAAWGDGAINRAWRRLHTHTAEYLCTSGTGNATVSLYGTNDPSSAGPGHLICTFTFTGAASGDVATPVISEHSWEYVRSVCTVLSGTGASCRVTVSGA